MKRNSKNLILMVWLLVSLFAFPLVTFADDGGPKGDQVIFGRNFILKSNETLDGNLAVLAGTVTLEENSNVTGDIFVAGGAIWVYGEVDGSLITLGGGVFLGEEAAVKKDVVVLGGAFNRAEGAVVGGQIVSSLPSGANLFRSPALAGIHVPRFWVDINPLWSIPKGLFESLLWAVLGALLVLFLPVPTEKVARAIVSQPVLAGGFGLLTIVIIPFVTIIFLITLVLIPLIPLLFLLLVFALIFGWISIGYEVGRRVAEQFNVQWAMAASTGIGVLIVTLVAKAIGSIACIGWVVPFFILMMGLGGVIITRFGSRNYPQSETEGGRGATSELEISSPPSLASDGSVVSENENIQAKPGDNNFIPADDVKSVEVKPIEDKSSDLKSGSINKEAQTNKDQPRRSGRARKSSPSTLDNQSSGLEGKASSRRKKSE